MVNSPDEPRPWEQPPTYSNPHVALTSIYDTLLTPESLEGLIGSLHDGVSVLDITSIILYAGFLEGKWSPDVMMLVAEPLMYLIMSFAEQVGIDYIIYDTPISEPEDTDDVSVGELSQIMKKENFFDKMKDNLIQKNIREDVGGILTVVEKQVDIEEDAATEEKQETEKSKRKEKEDKSESKEKRS